MGKSICVNVSAPAFSLLLYENARHEFDQEGFLLGKFNTREKLTITDNDHEALTIEHTVQVNSVIPCPKMGQFYSNSGAIDKKAIRAYLGPQFMNVVACYRFKRTTSFKLTLREKLIIKELASMFCPKSPEHFLWCLLTSQTGTDIGATHLFSQTFIRYNKPNFQSLPMHIVNLKDPHDIYKDPEASSATFKGVIKSLNIDVKKTQGYQTVSQIEEALDSHISSVVKKLSEAEKEMYGLEEDIKKLQLKLNTKQLDEADLEDEFGLLENGDVSMRDEISEPKRLTRSRTTSKSYAQTVQNNKT